ncbi:MAG: ribose-phosphate pyrophosphokinase [Candidatus Fermentibacter sp.]|nr:ribose-phosphate pyrophosphokinase [Candidatus Fermentibacter sp.]
MFGNIAICSGRSSEALAGRICELLGVEPEPVEFVEFSNGNLMVNFVGGTVREKDVFVIQSGERSIFQDRSRAFGTVSGDILELLQMMYAIKDSAGRITAVTPYFPYARSDKKDKPRIAISAKMMFDLMTAVRAGRVLTMTLHCPQSQGFSDIPVDQLHAQGTFMKKILELGRERIAFLAPDSGSILENDSMAVYVSRAIKEAGGAPEVVTGYVKKVRFDDSERPHVRSVEGVDNLENRTVIMCDDEILSGRSLVLSAETARDRGAEEIFAFVTHGVLSGQAVKLIEESPITRLFITDTIEFDAGAAAAVNGGPVTKIETVSVAPVFAEAIKRIHSGQSLSSLFL